MERERFRIDFPEVTCALPLHAIDAKKKNDVDDEGDRYTPTATVLPLIRLVPNQLDWHILSGDQVLTCNCLVTSRRF